ncbi:hypothetical protein V6N12_007708 [Hibiscus sabdariffa]|uniref:Uncharacterized protein n=1 Tax=Hibiscus sabdariffa TaxID=183260 RepID=A0ABR2F2J4_9ROSI
MVQAMVGESKGFDVDSHKQKRKMRSNGWGLLAVDNDHDGGGNVLHGQRTNGSRMYDIKNDDPLVMAREEEELLLKLEMLKRRGKGPPKKGQGRRNQFIAFRLHKWWFLQFSQPFLGPSLELKLN